MARAGGVGDDQGDDEGEGAGGRSSEPMRPRTGRAKLPAHRGRPDDDGMTFNDLVAGLRAVEGLRDVGKGHPNFQYRSRPFLHFHASTDGAVYADVRLGRGDFEPLWASTPTEREALLAKVVRHVERLERARKPVTKRR